MTLPARRPIEGAVRPGRLLAVVASFGAVASGALVGIVEPAIGAGAIGGLGVAVASVLTQAWLTLYVAAYPLQGISLFGVQAFGFRLSHVFFLVAVLALLLRLPFEGKTALPRVGLLDALVASFVMFTIASVMWSPAPASSTGVVVGKLTFNLMVYFALSALVQRDATVTFRRVIVGFGMAFLFMAGMAATDLYRLGFTNLIASIVVEQATTGQLGMQQLNVAIASLTGTAGRNIVASWMVLGLAVIWGVLSEPWRRLGKIERVLWCLAVAGAFSYIVLSLSRTTWLSLVVGGVILWWCTGRRVTVRGFVWLLVISGVLTIAIVGTGLGSLLTSRVRAVSNVMDTGVTGRFEVWKVVLTRFVDHPFLGVGIKGTEALTLYYTSDAANPHNVYVQILAELGLVGAVLFALFIGFLLRDLWWAGKVLPTELRRVAWGLLVAICCYLVQGLTQAEFMDLGIWTLLGLAGGLTHLQHRLPVKPAGRGEAG